MKRAISSLQSQEDIPKSQKILKIEVDDCPESHSENGFDPIWDQLQTIVNRLTSNGQNVSKTEINDVLLVTSQDPDRLTFFDIEYGVKKVESAIKAATKLLYPNGKTDFLKLSAYLWWKRNELVNGTNISYSDELSDPSKWTAIRKITCSLFKDYIFHIPRLNRKLLENRAQKLELNLLMATDPDRVREKIAILDIGQSKVEIGISICKHILEGMLKQHPNPVVTEFRQIRNKKIELYGERYLKHITPNYNAIYEEVYHILNEYWKNESPDQIDAFTILLMMEPKSLYVKLLFFTNTPDISNEAMGDIEQRLKLCLQGVDDKLEMKIPTPVDRITEVSMPIIAHLEIERNIKKMNRKINVHLRQKLSEQHDSEIAILRGIQNGIIVCANLKTIEWLTSILKELPFEARIDSSTQLMADEFKEVRLLSSVRLNKSFSFYMKKIKKYHPHFRTELWTSLHEITSTYDLWIYVDIYSIAHLELQKRRLTVEDLVLKFDIRY